ncbi:MAG TPA: MarR family transcriptional regulator [Casimicrobiaceae bacterium]|jgi:DNA-binding MarR family transcriptional regulator|nr:MarR family transcriptional regulator [Casimicrobiaceae bacterium]
MPGLKSPPASARPVRKVSYADPRVSGLIIHHMPGHFIRRLQQVAVKLFFVEVGIAMTPVQFAALAAVAQRPRIDQAALSALIGYDRATIGGVIDRLESKGWLVRSASHADRRVKLVRITAAGRKALRRALPAVRTVQAQLLEPLPAAERKRFERLCLKILAHHLG